MPAVENIVIGIIAALHIGILILEMFFWDKPAGLRVFGLTQEFATASRVLAANQRLYNGFFAAGLIWGLVPAAGGGECEGVFSYLCPDRGLYGAATASRKILFIQAVPAAIGLLIVFLS